MSKQSKLTTMGGGATFREAIESAFEHYDEFIAAAVAEALTK